MLPSLPNPVLIQFDDEDVLPFFSELSFGGRFSSTTIFGEFKFPHLSSGELNKLELGKIKAWDWSSSLNPTTNARLRGRGQNGCLSVISDPYLDLIQ
jgi:hypothetical protein